MTESDLMEVLAQTVRDERLLRDLERLAAGTLSEAERQSLEAQAQNDPALLRALVICRPVKASLHDRLAASARDSLITVDQGPQAGLDERAKTSAGWLRWCAWGVPVLAAAVIAMFFLVPASESVRSGFGRYRLEITAGTDNLRSPVKNDALKLKHGDSIEVRLRPHARRDSAVRAWFFVQKAQRVQRINLAVQSDPSGAVRAVGRVGEWASQAPANLVIALSDASTGAPSEADVIGRSDHFHWWTRRFTSP